MDSNSIMLSVGIAVLALFAGAFRFMRFIGFLTGTERKAKIRGNYPESHLSFDERIAERMRELERERR